MAGNQWSLVKGTWLEAMVMESLKPEQLSSPRACRSGCCEPPRRAGAPRRWPQYPLGFTRFCLGRETYTRESCTHTLLLSLPPPLFPSHEHPRPPAPTQSLQFGQSDTHPRQEGPVIQPHQHA